MTYVLKASKEENSSDSTEKNCIETAEPARYVLNVLIEGTEFGSMRSYYMQTIKREVSMNWR